VWDRVWYKLGRGFVVGTIKMWYKVYLLGVLGSVTRFDRVWYKLGQGCVRSTWKFGTRCIWEEYEGLV